MVRTKPSFFWPLRLIVAISLLAPTLLFFYATQQTRKHIEAQANERIERALDVLQEHALKAFQTVERSISETNEVLRGLSDEQIRASESDLYLRFKRTQQALSQIESIWAFDRDGHPLVSSTIFPVPRELNNSDRSYFNAQKEADRGTYIGEVVRAKVGSLRFFVVSGRRQGDQVGQFDGVIGVTIMPEHFSEFYRKLTRQRDTFALIRTDGVLLARYPEINVESANLLAEFSNAIRQSPGMGNFTATSPLDHVERRIGYRKVPGFPLYVASGIETAALQDEFWTVTAMRLAIGVPITLAMASLAFYALRRAQKFEAETARRETAEAALKQAQRLEAIGQLTGGIAHDFNNLLMIVHGSADRLKRYMPLEERSRRALEAIDVAVKRGTNLTRQLLSFSRRQTHEAKSIDLKRRLPDIQGMLQSSLRGDISVAVRFPPDIWTTKIDISEFELALLNLAVNARDAMSNGGSLVISAANVTLYKPNAVDLEGEFVTVTVKDTGTGIAPEVIGRVFEPFFTTKEIGKGTGLGLSQVYGFARQAGGTATVSSEIGRGTTVTLYLPRSLEPIDVDAPSDAADASQSRMAERIRVLLVEDNPGVADVTRGFLEQFGYSVDHALDVTAAQIILRNPHQKVDVVLSDIVMPGGANGVDLARWIQRQCGSSLPVILATGYSDKAQAAADEGFPILRKPYNAMELHRAIIEALQTARGQRVA